jgi:hypothetical protein
VPAYRVYVAPPVVYTPRVAVRVRIGH